MTIRRGEPWGEPGPLAPGAPVFAADRAAALALAAGAAEVGLVGGDLHRTLGSPRHDEDDLRAGRGVRHPVDLIEVRATRADGAVLDTVALAHVVVRGRSWWAGPTVVAMGGSFVGGLNLGPRAHPNDGRIDLTEGELARRDRRAARGRMVTGTHVPHPALAERRVRDAAIELAAPRTLWADGEPLGEVVALALRCRADAGVVVV